MTTIEIKTVERPEDFDHAARLMQDYKVALGLEIFNNPGQKADETLPGPYAGADAGILLAWLKDVPVGVVAFKPLGAGTSEMKRLYVSDEARGTGAGKQLARAVIDAAKQAGHKRMVLDTLESLAPACALYEGMGFERIERYNDNPVDGVVFYGIEF